MRIVYDYAGQNALGPVAPVSPIRGVRQTVVVVRVGREAADPGGSASVVAGRLPEVERWRTSDEAMARDREVRSHENAHLSTLGPYAASGIIYDTVTSASGESIAVGGRVAVDLAEVPGDPEATIRKARTVLNAAQAPGDPSAADMRVAARAYRLMQQAQAELNLERYA